MDSLAYHIYINRVGASQTPVKTLPYTSAAWYEADIQKKQMVMNRNLPRWKRQDVPELVFS